MIGSSLDGEADCADGPYYAFKLLQRVRDAIPSWWPLVGYEGNPLNVVPVDFVAGAIAAIAAKPGLDRKTFHIVDPEPLSLGDTVNVFLKAAHGPQFTLRVDPRAVGMVPKEFRGMLNGWKPYQALRNSRRAAKYISPAASSPTRTLGTRIDASEMCTNRKSAAVA